MRVLLGTLLLASTALTSPAAAQDATAQDAAALLQAADKASGASAVNSIVYSGTGRMGYPGQQYSTGDLPRTDLKTYAMSIDYGSKSLKEEFVRVQGDNIPRGGGLGFPVQGEQQQGNFLNGNYAWNLSPQGQPNPQPGNAAFEKFLIDISPHGFIKAGLAAKDATLSDRYFGRLDKTIKVVGFTAGKYRVTGEFGEDNLLSRVVTWFPDPVMGDKMVELRYTDYRDVGNGVKFPFHIHGHIGDHPLIAGGHNWIDVRVSDAKVNAEVAVPVPDNVRNAPPPQVRVVATKLGDGVWLMGGGSHNSLAVEFKDFITVIEGPLNEARSLAVIAEVKKTIPNKPIRYLVNTHNHFDHLGGTRTYVAEGATVITDDRNRDFYQQVVLAPQPRSLEPDALSQFPFAPTGPGTLALQTFSDRYTISDGQKAIELFHVEGLNHSDNMLVAYIPQDKILVNADLYSPPPAGGNLAVVNNNAVVFFNNVKRLKLDVAQHVPIHGNPGSEADFERIVGPVAAKSRPTGDGG
jgi:glyoxylase-like metal-dependent hydrolase (beta-lactamase superfamily II)